MGLQMQGESQCGAQRGLWNFPVEVGEAMLLSCLHGNVYFLPFPQPSGLLLPPLGQCCRQGHCLEREGHRLPETSVGTGVPLSSRSSVSMAVSPASRTLTSETGPWLKGSMERLRQCLGHGRNTRSLGCSPSWWPPQEQTVTEAGAWAIVALLTGSWWRWVCCHRVPSLAFPFCSQVTVLSGSCP